MIPELQRTRYITQNYNTLRGLVIVPAGLGIFLYGAWYLWLQQLFLPRGLSYWKAFIIQLLLFCLLVGCVFGAIRLITAYYDRTFGKIENRDNKAAQKQTIWMFITVLCGFAAAFDTVFHLPISITGLIMAILFFIRWWSLGRIPTHYLIVALLVALISIFPSIDTAFYQQLLAHNTETNFGAYEAIAYVLIGPLMIICGVLDHIMLIHMLAPDRREPEEETKWERS